MSIVGGYQDRGESILLIGISILALLFGFSYVVIGVTVIPLIPETTLNFAQILASIGILSGIILIILWVIIFFKEGTEIW